MPGWPVARALLCRAAARRRGISALGHGSLYMQGHIPDHSGQASNAFRLDHPISN